MRLTLSRVALPVSAAVLLLTAGCYRQAGEAIAPTSTGQVQVAVTRQPPVDMAVLPPGDLTNIPVPTSEQPATNAPAPLEPATPPSIPTSTVGLVILTSTPQYITPQMPLDFTTPDTPAPTVAPVLDTVSLTRTPGGPQSFVLPNSSDLLATPTNLPGVDDPCLYVIQPGDTLYAIALANGYTVAEIVAANPELGGAAAVIQPGDPLILPLPECVAEATADADGSVPAATRAPALLPTAAQAQPDGAQVHVVQAGDVLVNIANRYGTTVSAIVQANNLSNPNALQIGQELIIPPRPGQ
ncbi:MAG: LysM peptidoglycan-binding domain-containing protein [Anaerolineae bacterium]|nr:LysM peptidoglycan-binding domain-containing protein [Anaerolineae bacterium]